MSLPVNIENLLFNKTVESTRIEYKTGFDPNAVIHTICAFANDIDNTGGGYIIIGVEEENGRPKNISGVEVNEIDKILKELVGYCNSIEPRYLPVVEPINFNEKDIIVIWCPAGHGRPYKVYENLFIKSNKKYFIRKMNSTIIAKTEEERELFYISSDIPFDDRPNLAATVNDINRNLLIEHLYESQSDLYEHSLNMTTLDIARSMQLITGPDEDLRPKNIALLMFNENPEKFFRCARIEFVDIPNSTGEGMMEKVFSGPIQRQLKDALSFIKNYVISEKIFKLDDQAEAVRVFNYPYRAIEEILTNAVYHKSYTINEPITIRVTPTELEITSFPGLDRSITDENIRNFNLRARIYRNRRIGDFFKELRLTEGRNTGIPNVLHSLRENKSELPIFEMDVERRFLSVTLPVHMAFKIENKSVTNQPKIKPYNTVRSNRIETKKKVVHMLEDSGKISLRETARRLGNAGVSKTLSEIVDELEKEKIIKRVNSGRTSYIEIVKKYKNKIKK